MNRKQKKELRQRQSTRQLMGIIRVTPHGIVTDSGERVFFLIQPDNLSVLSPEVIRGRVRSLTMLLSTQPLLEILALDSRESFQRNKEYELFGARHQGRLGAQLRCHRLPVLRLQGIRH